MNKRKFLIIVIFIFTLFISIDTVKANEIYSIDTNVILEEDGTGVISQSWDTYVSEGTEFYIPIQYLNHMNLADISVSMNGREFKYIDDWDIDRSFEEKAYKYGILETDEGIEIAFGMSERENQSYLINFSYENMVQSFTDKDGFNVRFVNENMNPSPDRVSLKITSPVINFNEENSKIWAFGYGGNINFENGDIIATSTSEFSTSNHLTTLIEIDKGYFDPIYNSNSSFIELKEAAFEGSSYSMGDMEYENSNYESINDSLSLGIIAGIIGVFIAIIVAIIAIISSVSTSFNKKKLNLTNFEPTKEIPLDGDLNANYYFLVNLSDNQENRQELNINLFTSYLTKWVQDGYLSNEFEVINSPNFSTDNFEGKLWEFVIKGGLDNRKINSKKLEKYMEGKYMEFYYLFNTARKEGFNYSLENDYISKDRRFLILRDYTLTDKGLKEFEKVKGFKEYINNTEFYEEFNTKDSKIIKKLLVYSNLYSNNEKLIQFLEQRAKDEPEFRFFPYYLFYMNTHRYRTTVNKGYQTAINNASSGTGGGASFGGGGGFSGGGVGGGAR